MYFIHHLLLTFPFTFLVSMHCFHGSVIDFIREGSPFAILFYLAFLSPFLWMIFRKFILTHSYIARQGPKDRRASKNGKTPLALVTRGDNIILYFALFCFFGGTILLKAGLHLRENQYWQSLTAKVEDHIEHCKILNCHLTNFRKTHYDSCSKAVSDSLHLDSLCMEKAILRYHQEDLAQTH